MLTVATEEKRSPHWQCLGGINVLAAFIIMIVYCAIAGCVLNYLFKAVTTGFVGVYAAQATQIFDTLLASPVDMLLWTLLGMMITGTIIYAGVEKGIERAVKLLTPILFILP